MTSRMNTVTPCRLRQSNDEWCVAAIYLDHVTTPTWSSSHTSDDVTPRLSYNLSAAVVSGDENVDASSTTKRKGRPPVSLRPDKHRQWRQREFKVGGTNRRMGWVWEGSPPTPYPLRWFGGKGLGRGQCPSPKIFCFMISKWLNSDVLNIKFFLYPKAVTYTLKHTKNRPTRRRHSPCTAVAS